MGGKNLKSFASLRSKIWKTEHSHLLRKITVIQSNIHYPDLNLFIKLTFIVWLSSSHSMYCLFFKFWLLVWLLYVFIVKQFVTLFLHSHLYFDHSGQHGELYISKLYANAQTMIHKDSTVYKLVLQSTNTKYFMHDL